MIPYKFDYKVANSIEEAFTMLSNAFKELPTLFS